MNYTQSIADILNRPGSVIVMAADTVYGLMARAVDKEATERLYRLKDRHSKPGTLIGLDIDQLSSIGLKKRYLKAVEQYWPGPVSVIVPLGNPSLSYLSQGLVDLAVRVPNDPALRAILKLCGPLITSSANLPSQPPAVNIGEARRYFGDKVDAYFDGGDLSDRQPSTIIRVVDDAIEVIRQGAVHIASS